MKRILPTLFALVCTLQVMAIDASIAYATFHSPSQNYIELYVHLVGRSVEHPMNSDSLLQGQVEVVVLFQQNGEIVKFDKFNLNGPATRRPVDFIDLKRYGLDNGEYELVVAVQDLNREGNAKEYKTTVNMAYDKAGLMQSDIQLLAAYKKDDGTANPSFVRNGVIMEPLPYNFYGRNASSLFFYNELYQSDQALTEDFMVSYSIEQLVDGKGVLMMMGHKRLSPKPVIPLLLNMNISELPSGNYRLLVEARSRTKELLSQRSVLFQRSNPLIEEETLAQLEDTDIQEEFVQKLNAEQLEYSLRALVPRMPSSDGEMVNNMIRTDNQEGQRLYLFSYWAQESPNNPEFAYKKYMEVAAAIDKKFNSGFRHGFETDRGYMYLKYGQPDDIEGRDQEPSAPPYEIWTYYEFPTTNQNNVKFVFYNPSLSPGDYELLHSTAIGERNNPTWQRDLYREVPNEFNSSDYFGDDGMLDNFNRNANRVFTDY